VKNRPRASQNLILRESHRSVRALKEKGRNAIVGITVRLAKKYIEQFFLVGSEHGEAVSESMQFAPGDLWSFFRLPREEKEKTSRAVKYLDPEIQPPSELFDIIPDLLKANSPMSRALGFDLLAVQAKSSLESASPLLEKLRRDEDTSCRSAVLGALSIIGREEPQIAFQLVDDYLGGDIYDEVASFGWFLNEFGAMYSKLNPVKEISPITRIIEKSLAKFDLLILKRAIQELGNVGIMYPENALLTLKCVFHVQHADIRRTLIESLAKIRMVHPDTTEGFLDKEGVSDLLELTRGANVNFYFVTSGAALLFLSILFRLRSLKIRIIDILSRISEYDDETDFLKYAVHNLFEYVVDS